MPMTRRERERLERAETLAAMRWSAPVPRDVPAPEYGDPPTTGWDFNALSGRVWEGWSDSSAHGVGRARTPEYSAIQGPRAMYSSRLLALKAMRHEVEKIAARDLYGIDRKIDEAEAAALEQEQTR